MASVKYPINCKSIAKELGAYLLSYFIPEDHFTEIEKQQLPIHMQNLVYGLILNVISDTRNPLMRQRERVHETDVYEHFGEKTRLCPEKVNAVLSETLLLDRTLHDIYEWVIKNPWGVYTISQNGSFIEYHGDFRIMQWEKEHIVNGVYQECPLVD